MNYERERFNGGAAFACPETDDGTGGAEGMSLRDYFAGQALAGLSNLYGTSQEDADLCASHAFVLADSMIAAKWRSEEGH